MKERTLPKYISLIDLANGPSYQVQIRLNGHRFGKNYPTLEEASKVAMLEESAMRARTLPTFSQASEKAIVAKLENELLSDTILKFLKSKKAKKSHVYLARTVKNHIGQSRLCDLKMPWIQTVIDNVQRSNSLRGRLFSPNTVEKMMRFIGRVLRWRCDSLGVKRAEFPFTIDMIEGDTDVKRTRRITPAEEVRLLDVIRASKSKYKAPLELLIRFDIETGARLQELTKARWSDLNAAQNVLAVPKEHTKTKTEREIPFTKAARGIIATLGGMADVISDRIFHAFKDSHAASNSFQYFRKKAGIEDLRLHDLRHEGISRWLRDFPKMKVELAALMAGHTNTDMTQRYSNLTGEELLQFLE